MRNSKRTAARRGLIVSALAACLTLPLSAQLSSAGNEIWNLTLEGLEGSAASRATFGTALATGDFNGDGNPDLAIGIPDHSVSGGIRAGAVSVIYGSVPGLAASGSQFWTQETEGVPGTPEGTDDFGAALAAGDFNGDGFDDLAIGVPGEPAGAPLAGAVVVLYGSNTGLRTTNSQIWAQSVGTIQGEPEGGENFGAALAAGDFNGDGFDDLAVGVPRDGADAVVVFGAGAVNVIYGSSNRLTGVGNQIWHQNITGVEEVADENDRFGTAVAAGDFNGDGFDDLAVGVPNEEVALLTCYTGPRIA
jgi:hypothetical protein